MMAIHNSKGISLLATLIALLAAGAIARGQSGEDYVPVPNRTFERLAESAYLKTKEAFHKEPDNSAQAWVFGRACFEWADFSRSKEEREARAQEGISACRRAIELSPRLAPAHYYLALNLGQLARTKSLGALRLVTKMEEEFLLAIENDEDFDYGGPHRALANLYRDAPGWPASVGSRKKARHHLERALKLHPEYPGNQLAWLETLWQWGEKPELAKHLPQVEAMLPKARSQFAGEEWAADWAEWDKLWAQLKRQAG